MKKFALLFASFALVLAAQAKPEDPFTKVVPAFESIEITLDADVELLPGTPGKVEIIADEFAYNFLDIRVEEGRLLIGTKNLPEGLDVSDTKLTIYVGELTAINVFGQATVHSAGTLTADNLRVFLKGDGQLDLNLDAQRVDTVIRGNGTVNLSGSVKVAKVRNNGGTYNDSALTASTAIHRGRVSQMN